MSQQSRDASYFTPPPQTHPYGELAGSTAVVLRWLVQADAPQLPWICIGSWVLDSLRLAPDNPWHQCPHDKAASAMVVAVP